MNFLSGNIAIKSANFFSTRWTRNNTFYMNLLCSDLKYLTCSECRCRPISGKSPNIDAKEHDTNLYHERSYSSSTFGKVREYISLKKRAFDRYNNRRGLALLLYRTIDNIDFQEFYKFLELPDTFYSWFVLVELHLWMLMSQVMDNQSSSLKLRNTIIEVMWVDVETRVKNLGPVQKKFVKKQLKEFYGRLPVTLLAYDEGLLSNDTVLAAALWYKLFEKQCDDPIKLEVLVRYIRHQVQHLSGLELRDTHEVENIKNMWIPFSDHVKAVTAL